MKNIWMRNHVYVKSFWNLIKPCFWLPKRVCGLFLSESKELVLLWWRLRATYQGYLYYISLSDKIIQLLHFSLNILILRGLRLFWKHNIKLLQNLHQMIVIKTNRHFISANLILTTHHSTVFHIFSSSVASRSGIQFSFYGF